MIVRQCCCGQRVLVLCDPGFRLDNELPPTRAPGDGGRHARSLVDVPSQWPRSPLAGSRSGSGLTPAGFARFKCHCKATLACLRSRRRRGLLGGAWACAGAVPQSLWFLAMTLVAHLTQARALLSATRNPPPTKSGTSSNLISGSGLLNSIRLKKLNGALGAVAMDTEAEGGTNFPTSFGQNAVVALLFWRKGDSMLYISPSSYASFLRHKGAGCIVLGVSPWRQDRPGS